MGRVFYKEKNMKKIIFASLLVSSCISMPTFADIVNVECPPTDGISLLPTLLGDTTEQKEHEYLYWEYPDKKIGSKAIRMGKWKGIITNIRKGNTKMELFDLENDIKELNDVSDKYPDVVEKLYSLMEKASVLPKNPNFRF